MILRACKSRNTKNEIKIKVALALRSLICFSIIFHVRGGCESRNLESSNEIKIAVLSSLNITTLPTDVCKTAEFMVSYLTSLSFDENFTQVFKKNTTYLQEEPANLDMDLFHTAGILISICMLLFGSCIFLPMCAVAAGGMGVLLTFHLAERNKKYFVTNRDLECKVKLVFALVGSCTAAMTSVVFVRFGMFVLGAVTAGGGSYLILDSFQDQLDDHGQAQLNATSSEMGFLEDHSDLSASSWAITISLAFVGGFLLRCYEQASLEVMTATLGGVGCAYSVHNFFFSHGTKLDRSVITFLATIISFIGWNFQRGRRVRRSVKEYQPLYDLEGSRENVDHRYRYSLPLHRSFFGFNQRVKSLGMSPHTFHSEPWPGDATWSISMPSLEETKALVRSTHRPEGPSSEQVVELTNTLKSILDAAKKDIVEGNKPGGGKQEK